MTFKPMLASNVSDFSRLKFPLLVSPKLDGVRATVQGGKLLSRSLKEIPNKFVQEKFRNLPEGTDGELIVGDAWDDPYRRTVSVVMSDDKPADGVTFCVFDKFAPQGHPFELRFRSLGRDYDSPGVIVVPHYWVVNLEELEEREREFLSAGYEGLMIRDPLGPYKQGRSSEKEGWLLKVKRFLDGEAVIVGTEPEMANNNEAFTNELGRTARSTAKAGRVAKETLGKMNGRGVGGTYDGVEFDIAVSSLVHTERKRLWDDRENLVGKLVVYKYFPTGGDTRPRHPIFKGFRDARDLS